MAASTTVTHMGNVIQTYIEKTAYPLLSYNVVYDTYARLVPLPSGHTVRVPLLYPHSTVKSNLTETTTTYTVTTLIPAYMEKAIEFFGAYNDISKKAAKSSLIDAVKYARGMLEQQAARSINRKFAYAISSPQGMRYQRVASTGDQALKNKSWTSGTGLTFMVNHNLQGTPNASYAGGQVFFTSGVNAGLGRKIKSASTSSSTITVTTAFPQTPSASDTLDIHLLQSISTITTYEMSLADVFKMAELARRSGAQGFTPGQRVREDGFGIMRNVAGTVPQLVLFIDTQCALDIMEDSATNGYSDVFKQTESGLQRWSKGQFGLVNNVSFIQHNEGWRTGVTGTESDTGVVHTPTLVGLNSYFSTKFRGVGQKVSGLEFRVKSPGPQTFSVMHEQILYRVEWDAWMGAATQNGFHGCVMLCGASTDA